jgi:adenosylcobinamide-phosphate synthase
MNLELALPELADAAALILVGAMAVALWADRRWGEPRAAWHPVVWMGRWLSLWQPRLARLAPRAALLGGALAWLGGALVVISVAVLCESSLWSLFRPWESWPGLVAMTVSSGLLLKPLLAWRMLREEAAAVEAALGESLEAGRARLARLVSRDTTQLSATEVREAALETLAENLNDSVIAPLFWYALAGLPGAALYRYANTADAMWGYRDHREWSGKWAARADDVLSWLPARLTGLALLPAPSRWGALAREARRTPSPNGGWPMGALALRLDRCLRKPGVYRLHEAGQPPAATDLPVAIDACRQALRLAVAVLAATVLLSHGPSTDDDSAAPATDPDAPLSPAAPVMDRPPAARGEGV